MVEDDNDFNLDYYVLTSEEEMGSVAYQMQAILDHKTEMYE